MLTLSGIAIVILGFALRFNPLLVVVVAGIVTGLAGGLSMEKILVTFGDAFVKNRYLSLFLLTLPVIGLLERNGLKEQSQALIGKIKAATTGRLLILYLFIREAAAAEKAKLLEGDTPSNLDEEPSSQPEQRPELDAPPSGNTPARPAGS